MPLPFSYRTTNILLFITPAALLAYGYYLQFYQGQEPCPLCMTQRICFYGIALLSFIAIFNRQSVFMQRGLSLLTGLIACIGLGVAGRQLWLQSLPEDQVPACGPAFDYIINSFPLNEAIAIMFRGNGNCAEVSWTFLGLSIAGWAFIAFTGFLVASVVQGLRRLN